VDDNQQRRNWYAALDVVTLCVFVLTMYAMGLPSIVAIMVGAPLAGVASAIVHRQFFPRPPQISDEERLQLPRLRPIWLPIGIMSIALLYFGAHMQIAIASALIVFSIGTIVVLELSERRKAEERLSHSHGDAS
jgi:hypothetical protein